MITTIYTSIDQTENALDEFSKARCIFRGDIPHLLRADDMVVVLDGFCVERVKYVYYDIPTNTQEVHLATYDVGREYPTVKL